MTISPTYYTFYKLSTPANSKRRDRCWSRPFFFWLELISTYTHELFKPNPIC